MYESRVRLRMFRAEGKTNLSILGAEFIREIKGTNPQ